MQGMNTQSGMHLAHAFFEMGANALHEQPSDRRHINEGYVEKTIAGTASIAFACEVAIKNVICKRGACENELRGHNLEQLYKKLTDNDRHCIESITIRLCNGPNGNAYGHEQFIDDLQTSARVFEELRYWYEIPNPGKGKQARVAFMHGFGRAVILWMDAFLENKS